jgi:hypothetical protein
VDRCSGRSDLCVTATSYDCSAAECLGEPGVNIGFRGDRECPKLMSGKSCLKVECGT